MILKKSAEREKLPNYIIKGTFYQGMAYAICDFLANHIDCITTAQVAS